MLSRLSPHRLFAGRFWRGQTLVETALILPLFLMVIFGIITLGLGIFYQQQVTNAAREAARYAAIHSATATCPTVPQLTAVDRRWDPDPPISRYFRCDPPPWTDMTAAGRAYVSGLPANQVHFSACWSSYWTKDGAGDWSDYDAPPAGPSASPVPTYFRQCTIAGVDAQADPNPLTCPAPAMTSTDDTGSALAMSMPAGSNANRVTIYACYVWRPPLAGFLLLPNDVTFRAVITETLEYQR